MPSAQAAVLLLLALIAWTFGVCIAEEFTVGDRAGWHPGNNVDYQQWAARHSYRVGDSLLFAYDRGSQSVMRVGSEDYHACRTHRPIDHHTTGSTLIDLKREDYFFISGVAGHCNAGMKLAVILAGTGSPSAAPSTPPPPPPVATPTTPPVVAPTLAPPPLASPTPAPVATTPAPVAPASAPIASAPPSPTEAPAPTSGLSPPAPFAFGPALAPSALSPTAPPPSAASVLQSTISAVIIVAAVGSFSLLL